MTGSYGIRSYSICWKVCGSGGTTEYALMAVWRSSSSSSASVMVLVEYLIIPAFFRCPVSTGYISSRAGRVRDSPSSFVCFRFLLDFGSSVVWARGLFLFCLFRIYYLMSGGIVSGHVDGNDL